MFKGEYTYLLLNILTIAFPLILSFDRKVAFYKSWKHLFPAIALTGTIFIIWDVWFTAAGVWSFNEDYLLGIKLLNLPLEEWLFFITVPYACVFIYECLRCWFAIRWNELVLKRTFFGLVIAFILLGILGFGRMYTSITFFLSALFMIALYLRGGLKIMHNFLPAYGISILPFFIVNGVLTANPVVMYNDFENFGMRIGTIPVEDFFYGFLLVLMNTTFMEVFRGKFRILKTQKLAYETQ